jgi:hypothetical protein
MYWTKNIRFEVFTALTMKNGVFWVVTSVLTRATRRNNPEDTIPHGQRIVRSTDQPKVSLFCMLFETKTVKHVGKDNLEIHAWMEDGSQT